MNPSGAELQLPVEEKLPHLEEQVPRSIEAGQSTPEILPSPHSSQHQLPQTALDPKAIAIPQDVQPVEVIKDIPATTSASSAVPLAADDSDIIEKEWIERLDTVISTTRDDPYEQKKQISKLSVDYQAARFGKTITSSDESKQR